MALQNVTINTGAKENGACTPRLGEGLFMAAGSSIIGTKTIGNWVSVGAGALVYDQEIEDYKLVINRSGKMDVLENQKCGQRWYWRIF